MFNWLLVYRPVEVRSFVWEDRPFSLWKSVQIRFHDFMYKRFPTIHIRFWFREHAERELHRILLTEMTAEINNSIIEKIKGTVNAS